MAKYSSSKSGNVLSGSGSSCYPLAKEKPGTNVDFGSPNYVDVTVASNFQGNDDNRPHIDDNENGKNNWIKPGKEIDGNKLRFGNQHTFGPGFSKLEKV